MRDEMGRFTKGYRASPSTEFQKGQHWRPQRPYWDKEWLETEYASGRSANDIAQEFGITEAAILFWLRKHGIPRRTMSEIRAETYWGSSGPDNPMYGKRGPEASNWKGGCTPERQAFYSSKEWAQACQTVWKRDNAQCVRCKRSAKDITMHVHHIVSFAVEHLRADPENLVLLCEDCHRWVHSKENADNEYRKEVTG